VTLRSRIEALERAAGPVCHGPPVELVEWRWGEPEPPPPPDCPCGNHHPGMIYQVVVCEPPPEGWPPGNPFVEVVEFP
jgi:hypothetical protein